MTATTPDLRRQIHQYLLHALEEDHGAGDHSSLAVIPAQCLGRAQLKIKSECRLAGMVLASELLAMYHPGLQLRDAQPDGADVAQGQTGFCLEGPLRALLGIERLLLNSIQHMSAIATQTRDFAEKLRATGVRLLDTRKTTPNMRFLDKWAVRLGGGDNHRFGLYDMIMLKDNHVDAAGGIGPALRMAHQYREAHQLDIPIELETRSLEEVRCALAGPVPDILMLDNFDLSSLREAVLLIGARCQTEASGGITLDNVLEYAQTGVGAVSTSVLTRPQWYPDLSLKIVA
jgi:nicotinate-nucleotide pyrophosphorylase (carboxylating)